MKNLERYLGENHIDFTKTDDNLYSINNQTYEYVEPIDDVYFNNKFDFIYKDSPADFYIILFGGRYYYISTNSKEKVKLNLLRYLGNDSHCDYTLAFLGVHGPYEICNGSRLYKDWIKKANFLQVKYLGICEKNTLAGLIKFQLACKENDIKPILGASYTVYNVSKDIKYDVKCYIKNLTGYKNILRINKKVNCDNNKFIEENDFLNCLEGLVIVFDPKSIDYKHIITIQKYLTVFYQLDTCEFIKYHEDEEYLANLQKFIYDERFRPVSITDAYYLDKEDRYSQNITNTIISKHSKYAVNQYFKSKAEYHEELKEIIKSPSFLEQLFHTSINNELAIAKNCDFEIDTSQRHLPKYEMTDDEKATYGTKDKMVSQLIAKGVNKFFKPDMHKKVYERLKHEYNIIKNGNLIDYFLIQRDIIVNFCQANNILVAPGRGSSAGSLLAYILEIVQIDALEFDLIFERFLNPGRVKTSLPDIDIDFPSERRDEVKRYIEHRYGDDHVCSVGTYLNLKIKSLLKDLARQKNIPVYEMNILTSIIHVEHEEFEEIFRIALKKEKLMDFIHDNPDIINLFPLLLNHPKSESIHASAVIITPKGENIYENIPVKKVLKNGEEFLVSEWEGDDLEKIGYLKEDILGISQLDKFQYIIDKIKENTGLIYDIKKIPLDDASVYEYFCNGYNSDVFHFGSKLLKNYCTKLLPENIHELIKTNALMRPGAMENNFHNKYVQLKHDHSYKIEYIKGLEKVTEETKGLIVFQEQIMKAFTSLANFTLEEADNIRKAMGKKDEQLLQSYHERFIEGAVANNYLRESANIIWKTLEKFSGYGFNKSHATAYSIMGYRCQYLKRHFEIYYWAAAFEKVNTFKKHELIPQYINEIYKIGNISLEPAHINKSQKDIKIVISENKIFWTLNDISFCGETAIDQVLNEREDNGEYFSFSEFCDRNIFLRAKVNKRVIENLVLSGVFDEIEGINNVTDRYELILKYRDAFKVKVNEDIDLFYRNRTLLKEKWWYDYQQRNISNFGLIDYEKLVANEIIDFNGYYYIDAESIFESQYVGDRVIIAGYVLDVQERESTNGIFANITLDINYEFVNILIWPDKYEVLRAMYPVLKKSILIMNGIVAYDEFREENIVRSTEHTSISVIN